MSETNKSYRIRTDVGRDNKKEYITVSADLTQDYDTFEILSVNINSKDAYTLHNSNYGVVVGRVIANNGFGIPNAKVSIFINADLSNNADINSIYPFTSSNGKDKNGVRYNLLPNDRVDGCHQIVGTFPTKRYALDNDVILEIYDKYYTYTTKTNNSGDYMICGVPVGTHTIHMDLDLSDCGILSQKPRDFVYKGYTIEQFETPTKFKGGTDYNNLSQVFSQDQVLNVNPFWGNTSLGETIGITRCDIDVNFKFEPTCVFMGSIISDNSSNGFSSKCRPTDAMGYMDELVTGEGRIEMIRKTPGGSVEEFQIKGNKLINANGVWCYQIPMNLDYMVTDEYGNMVPTDNPERGIPTRTSVRFRISMEDSKENPDNFFRGKVLVPHNPKDYNEGYDYVFGTDTKDDSFRDLYWNNVYSVKSYIPRLQKSNNWKKEKFSGIKHCNKFGPNNPMPYNNIRIKLPFMFMVMCALIKAFIFIVSIINTVNVWIFNLLGGIADLSTIGALDKVRAKLAHIVCGLRLIVLKDGLCPDLENWYFSPCSAKSERYLIEGCTSTDVVQDAFKAEYIDMNNGIKFYRATDEPTALQGCDNYEGGFYEIDASGIQHNKYLFWKINLLERTLASVDYGEFEEDDEISIDATNDENQGNEAICITTKTDYLIACIEMNLAQEYNVINFDFYNDWINGCIYNPRWVRFVKKKVRFWGIDWLQEKVKGCMDDPEIFHKQGNYAQQCSIGYKEGQAEGYTIDIISKIKNPIKVNGEYTSENSYKKQLNDNIKSSNNYHKGDGFKLSRVFGKKNGGICHEQKTIAKQNVYYLKPCEFSDTSSRKKTILYATDIILLGTFNDCDLNGIPKTFTHLTSTTYLMPTNLALTNMDTNGPLYAKDDGTICMGGNGVVATNGIKEIDVTNNKNGVLASEYRYLENSPLDIDNKKIFGDSNTEKETIAITEAAGIAWNWTGPGQGKIDEARMYYPGGHFLGLSCMNSQSNIKSCLNLSRICEIGANMSQRREDVRSVGDGGFKYTYSVPSGFISGDEISDGDFRTMFATLNKKRLVATKRNPKTGYKVYDFEFVQPINFDGSFSEIVYGDYLDHTYSSGYDKRPYNSKIYVSDSNLEEWGGPDGANGQYEDNEESANTQTRTMENTSLDYYLYRFGLTYDEAKMISNIQYKFLRLETDLTGTYYYLPQYENSYYFYFGLKQGATALDEFNKQFYAECDEIKLKTPPRLILASEINFCDGKGNIHIVTEGLSTPYQYVKVERLDTQEFVLINGNSNESQTPVLNMESFYFPDGDGNPIMVTFGQYKVTIMDSDGLEINEQINIGTDLFKYDLRVVNFTKQAPIVGNNSIYNGGFVVVENFSCSYETNENINYQFRLKLGYDLIDNYEYIDGIGYLVYGEDINKDYELFVTWVCDGHERAWFKIGNVTFKDNSEIDLRIGYNSGSCIYTESCINNDYMHHMSSEFWFDKNNDDIGAEDGNDTADKWFFRKMFFKESNFGAFNSRVFPTGGSKKVLWGPAQQPNNSGIIVIDNDGTLYCSENYLGIPAGSYLDDTRTLKPTYGASYCDTNVNLRAGSETNCTCQYCAQAYKDTDVCGEYRGRYSRNNGITMDTRYFHEGYGCVFKPLPYGSLRFLVYNGINDLKEALDNGTYYNYGVIYPTFIYPVMKRPFYGDFSVRIYGDFDVNIVEGYDNYEYSINNRNILSNELLKIHNGITFNRKFNSIQVYSRDFESNVLSSDTYNITLSDNVDRIYNCDHYESDIECTNGTILYNNVYFGVTEGYPNIDGVSALAKTITVSTTYNFYDNLCYRYNTDENKVFNVYGEGSSDSGITYYLGCYGNDENIEFITERDDSTNKKYAYNTDSDGYYAVLCRFEEDASILESKWYTNVFTRIGIIDDSSFYLKYEYVDEYGNDKIFDEMVSIAEAGDEFNGINGLLSLINNGYEFAVYDETNGYGNGQWYYKIFPFKPVMNYNVLNGDNENAIVAYGTSYYGPDFKSFMQRMMGRRKLVSIDNVDSLSIGDFSNSKMFGIGVKAITSNEDNESLSYVFKVYPNPFRHLFYGNVGDYTITIDPETYNYYSGELEYVFENGENSKNATVTVENPCIVRIYIEENSSWCHYVIDDGYSSSYGGDEINFNGAPIHLEISVDDNNLGYNRECSLVIESYYGGIRDTKTIKIRQNVF